MTTRGNQEVEILLAEVLAAIRKSESSSVGGAYRRHVLPLAERIERALRGLSNEVKKQGVNAS